MALPMTGRWRPSGSGTVSRAAGALLGAASVDVAPDAAFTDLGGDSLLALTFADLLHDIFDVEVPVGVIVSPASDLAATAAYVEARACHSICLIPGGPSSDRRSGGQKECFVTKTTRVSAEESRRPASLCGLDAGRQSPVAACGKRVRGPAVTTFVGGALILGTSESGISPD